MAYIFEDGFDNLGDAYKLLAGYPWDTINGNGGTTSASVVRFAPPAGTPGGSVNMTNGNSGWIRKNLVGNPATVYFGFGFKLSNLPGSTHGDICDLWDSGTAQVGLAVDSNGCMQFYRSAFSGTAIGAITAAGTIQAGVWYGVKIGVTISSSGGTVVAYLNGSPTPIIQSSGLNTQASAHAYATQVSLGSIDNGQFNNVWYDDFWCFDNTGSYQNAIPAGDPRIITKMPSGVGHYTGLWTPNGAATGWQCNDSTPPSLTKYVSDNNPGDSDSYLSPVVGLSVAPISVTVRQSVTKDDSNVHTASALVRSAGVDGVGTAFSVNSSYTFVDTPFPLDPSTGSPWTAGSADLAEIGIIEVS